MKNQLRYQIFVSCLAAGWGCGVQAQGSESVKLGEANVTPGVRVEYLTNSNAYVSSNEEVGATGVRVSPRLEISADRRLLDVKLGYEGDYANLSEEAINFDDHRLYGIVDLEIDTRQRVNGIVQFSKKHEEFGKGRTFGAASSDSDAVEYFDFSLDSSYTYGALSAKGNLTGGMYYSSRSYQNRADLTTGADVAEISPYGQFSYRVSPSTRALLELRLRSLNFDTDSLDRTEFQALLGLGFLEGGKTAGSMKVGVGSANYDDEATADTNFVVVRTNLTYSPSTYSKLSINYSRQLNDSDLATVSQSQSQTIQDVVTLAWAHQWSAFVDSSLSFKANLSDRDCPTVSSQTSTIGFELGVTPRRWLRIGVGLANESRDVDGCSNEQDVSVLEFERQIVSLFVNLSL